MCDCANSDVHFELSDTSWLLIPNVFTPNGDGINELWEIDGLEEYPDSRVKIMDESLFNKTLFESTGYTAPWDGKRNGKNPKDGKYKYEIEVAGRKIIGYVCVFGTSDFEPEPDECFMGLTPSESGDPFFW